MHNKQTFYNIAYILQSNFQMDAILQQKKKGERNFRNKIDDFISKSPYAKLDEQLSTQTIQELLQMPFFDGVCTNGKVNIQKLCEKVTVSEPKYTPRDLCKVLGGRKEMKVTELQQTLKNYQLHEFNLEEQMTNLLFQGNALSLSKVDHLMGEMGLPPLNAKDKQILIECFDYDRNGSVDRADLASLMEVCREVPASDLRSTQFRQ